MELAEQKRPEPPKVGAYIAALLELSFLAVFAYNRSVVGALTWVVYFRFSALKWLVFGK